MDFEDFKKNCLNSICNRHTFISKQCEKNSKIEKCFKKYNSRLDKIAEKKRQKIIELHGLSQCSTLEDIEKMYGFVGDIDFKWEKTKAIVKKRDNGNCVIWNHLLNKAQRLTIIRDHWNDFSNLHCKIDYAHIESRARRPDLKYDPDNVIILFRFFHSRLDQMKNLVTGENTTNEERNFYLKMLKDYIIYINKGE